MINNGRALFSRVLHDDTEVQKKPLKKKKLPIIFDEPEFPGLPLGSYEEKRKELVKERNIDYNKFLEEKEKQEEFKRYIRKLQSEFDIILPDPADFATSYSMLTSNNIFGFAPPVYGQHSNGLLPYDNKQTKEEYRQALQQQIDDQKKRKEMEKLKDMQSEQQQPLYQPSFIDGSAHRRPYLMQQSGVPNQTSISPSVSMDSLEHVSTTGSIPAQANSFPVMPSFSQTLPIPNVNSGLLFGSEPTKTKDKEYYREDLRRQIEEKKRREEEEKARLQMEEACLALRVEQQRLRMLQEYENERQKKLQKEEELRRKQEKLWQLQEQQRKEAEDSRHLLYKRKLEESEKGRAIQKVENSEVAPSAPITSTQIQAAKPEIPSQPTDPRSQVLSQLSLIRQQLHEEKKQKKEMLQQKKTYQVMDRADDDDGDNDDTVTPVLYKTEQGNTI